MGDVGVLLSGLNLVGVDVLVGVGVVDLTYQLLFDMRSVDDMRMEDVALGMPELRYLRCREREIDIRSQEGSPQVPWEQRSGRHWGLQTESGS